MDRRSFLGSSLIPLLAGACATPAADHGSPSSSSPQAAGASERAGVLDAMRRAVRYMDEQVSYRGGYVWAWLPDLSLSWGEMEAKRSMCWIQPPGTPAVAHAFIDAWQAAGDPVFRVAAERAADALVAAQLPCGGWNYIHDFAGEDSLRHWYDTIGRNGWRLEEFQHWYGNATFDDAVSSSAACVLLRVYQAWGSERFRAPLARAIDFVLAAQYSGGIADGGWPQRWPRVSATSAMKPPYGLPRGARGGMEDGDYTAHVTWNDDVAGENIRFLLLCHLTMDDPRLAPAIVRAMDCMARMQQPAPQAGWGLQHLAKAAGGRPAGAIAAARSYEPRALATHTTATNIRQLCEFYRLSGDERYLARIPEALAWLKRCELPARVLAENPLLKGRTHPTFVDEGSNRARYVHRYGSNVHNGAYYSDHDHRDTLSHYSAGRMLRVDALEAEYQALRALAPEARQALKDNSPLLQRGKGRLPRFFGFGRQSLMDAAEGRESLPAMTDEAVAGLLKSLGTRDYWLAPLPAVTNPYRGDGPRKAHSGREYMSRHVGDIYDTSPYDAANPPEIAPYVKRERPEGIVSQDFTRKLGQLTAWLVRQAGA